MAKTSYQIERREPTLPSERAIELIRRQMDQIDGLLQLTYNDPEVNKWDNITEQILINAFGKPHDNLSDFNHARHGGSVIHMGMEDYELQEAFKENLENSRKILEGFIEQLQMFAPQKTTETVSVEPITKTSSKKIFIVHGHDDQARGELALAISRLGLEPIILHEQANEGMTVIEKLEKYSEVGYAFIILTPDDIGAKTEQKDNLQPRARQNVVFEFGIFVGKLGRNRVCCLYKGDMELPSDLHGLLYIPFETSVNEKQIDIVKELRAAGYEVNI